MERQTRPELDLERERQRLIDELLAAEGLGAPVVDGMAPRDPGVPVPLTYAQEVLWLLDRATRARAPRGERAGACARRARGKTRVAPHRVRTARRRRGAGGDPRCETE